MSSIDTSRFGTGFVPEASDNDGAPSPPVAASSSWSWWSSGGGSGGGGSSSSNNNKGKSAVQPDEIVIGGGKWDDEGAGGAVPVAGYHGRWPLYGDVYSVKKQRLREAERERLRLMGAQVDHGSSLPSSPSSSSSSSSSAPFGASSSKGGGDPGWLCRSADACKPCSADEITRPFCQPYGNKAPVECRRLLNASLLSQWVAGTTEDIFRVGLNVEPLPSDGTNATTSPVAAATEEKGPMPLDARAENSSPPPALGDSVYRGYQVCGRSIEGETWDYGEFMGLNLIIALVSLFVLLQRQRFLAGQHRSILARRIGRSPF